MRGPCLEECVHLGCIVAVAELVSQIGARRLGVLDDAGALRASGLRGIHIQPPDQAVVPPNTALLLDDHNFSPWHAAVDRRPTSPPAPEPITSTSQAVSGKGDIGWCYATFAAARAGAAPPEHGRATGRRG